MGRFAQADTIIPDPANPADLNRYTYVRNNPLKYTDSTGHYIDEGPYCLGPGCSYDPTSTSFYIAVAGGSVPVDTYLLSPAESKDIFSVAVAQRVSQGTVGKANDPQGVAPLYIGAAAALAGWVANLPMPGVAAQINVPSSLQDDVFPEPSFDPAASETSGYANAFGGSNPPINTQKQAGHIPGTPQYANRIKFGKLTSTFFDKASADSLAVEAWQKGTPLSANGSIRLYEFSKPVGTGPFGGGYQTQVRVSMDAMGQIHGTPWGPVYYGPLP